uniref:Shugoshin C-terminal domain-containing protein n=1 Tax=Peronospora matthiolae TaxID=2874970 RepID=A0AAV1UGV3_9STRA
MDEANARFQAVLFKANSKRAKYKADCTKAQTTVRHLRAALAAVSVESDQLRDDLAELEAEYDRPRSLLSDRDDRVGMLQATISGLELERDQVLRDRDVLRTSIAALVTSPSLPSSSRPVETAPSTSARVKLPSTSAQTPLPRTKRARIEATSQSVVKMTPKTHSPTAFGIFSEPSTPCKIPKNNPSRSPHSSTRYQSKLTPKTPALPGPGVQKGKGRARNPTPAPASSDDDDSSDAGPRTLAALSRSRSSSRRKVPLGNPATPSSTLPELIVVDTSSPDVDSLPPQLPLPLGQNPRFPRLTCLANLLAVRRVRLALRRTSKPQPIICCLRPNTKILSRLR